MELATIFKLSIYLLTAAVGLVLGCAEWGWIPFVSLPMTILGYAWCEVGWGPDRSRTRGLGELPSVLLGGLSLTAAAMEFFSDNPEGKLLSGIHLVVYLTWIVLLQRKRNPRYWQLLVLGVLQVAVASVLTNGHWFGLSVIGYLVAATWTMSVFSLYRAAQEFAEDERRDAERHRAVPTSPDIRHDGTLAGSPEQRGTIGSPAVSAGTNRLTSQAFRAVCSEDGSQWVSPRFVGGVALSSFLGLFVGAVFFAFIPRIWIGTSFGLEDDELPPTLRMTITGLANEIRLGDMRPALESNDPVLSIRLFDNQTNQPIDPETHAAWLGHREPLFRGVILTDYEGGRWRPNRLATELAVRLFATPDDPAITGVARKAAASTIRQEVNLQYLGNDILFCLGQAVAMRDPEGFRCGNKQQLNDVAVRRPWFKELSGAVDYVAYSELPQPTDRVAGGPVTLKTALGSYRFTNYFKRCIAVPDSLTRLVVQARNVVDAEQNRVGRLLTELEQARAIESHLRDSRIYTYSLDTAPSDSKIDPVEDFLFNRHAGHCQYFASALGLMLRSVGIPARLVTGFKGGETREDGRLHVEKRFAHAWVEAWIDDEMWVTLDATPEAERTASVIQVGTQRNLWATMSSRLSGVWEYNVLNISLDRQEDLFYRPMREFFLSLWENVTAFLASPFASLTSLVSFLINPRNWLTWRGAMTLLTLFGLLWLLRRGSRRLGLTLERTKSDEPLRRQVEFYERFVRLMQSHGQERRPAQTQGEFVQDVAGSLAIRFHDTTLTPGLALLGDLFYRVRFGDEELPAQEASHLDALLADLEQTLGPATNHRIGSRWRMPWSRE
jgi:protein-glutamine gamma-glutamyltransferase